jgi:hypothetical protein
MVTAKEVRPGQQRIAAMRATGPHRLPRLQNTHARTAKYRFKETYRLQNAVVVKARETPNAFCLHTDGRVAVG